MSNISGNGYKPFKREVDWTYRIVPQFPPSPNLTLMVFSCWGNLKEHVYAVPISTIEDLAAKLQAGLTTVDDKVLKRVQDVSPRIAVWLP